ncbi:MAG TPA: hypothetical protein VHA52_06925 [Candidatus Babeliaceae bacterium]|nr:hypothetical protein [Candidatus Babeliaceae bacterium]
METNHNIPKWVIRSAVTDCADVQEFAHKYRKPDRFTGRGEDHVKAVMKTHAEDIARHGYTSISHHDNITARIVTYIPQIN